jgi:hypothetical protein
MPKRPKKRKPKEGLPECNEGESAAKRFATAVKCALSVPKQKIVEIEKGRLKRPR